MRLRSCLDVLVKVNRAGAVQPAACIARVLTEGLTPERHRPVAITLLAGEALPRAPGEKARVVDVLARRAGARACVARAEAAPAVRMVDGALAVGAARRLEKNVVVGVVDRRFRNVLARADPRVVAASLTGPRRVDVLVDRTPERVGAEPGHGHALGLALHPSARPRAVL